MNATRQYILIVRDEKGLIAHVSQHDSKDAATGKADKLSIKSRINLFGTVYLHNHGDAPQAWKFVTNICM